MQRHKTSIYHSYTACLGDTSAQAQTCQVGTATTTHFEGLLGAHDWPTNQGFRKCVIGCATRGYFVPHCALLRVTSSAG
jgi:hypothetical protein